MRRIVLSASLALFFGCTDSPAALLDLNVGNDLRVIDGQSTDSVGVDSIGIDSSADSRIDSMGVDGSIDSVGVDGSIDSSADSRTDSVDADGSVDGSIVCPVGSDPTLDVDGNGIDDCSENLLNNGQFATNTAGWIWDADSNTLVWSSEDAEGNNTSGSASASNLRHSASQGFTNGAEQCVVLSPSTAYTIWGKFYIPSGQAGGNPGAGFGIFLYASDNCLGSVVAGGVKTSAYWSSPTDSWVPQQHSFTTTADTQSARIRLNITNPLGTTAPLEILYDSMLLHP